nr:hypothetical protein GCM10025730_42520 [Promicromonospora thailandica]
MNSSGRHLGRTILRTLLAVLLGVVLGALGTVVHRYGGDPWYPGLVLALALTVAAGVLARAWAGYGTLLGFGVGWVGIVQALSLPGSGATSWCRRACWAWSGRTPGWLCWPSSRSSRRGGSPTSRPVGSGPPPDLGGYARPGPGR